MLNFARECQSTWCKNSLPHIRFVATVPCKRHVCKEFKVNTNELLSLNFPVVKLYKHLTVAKIVIPEGCVCHVGLGSFLRIMIMTSVGGV